MKKLYPLLICCFFAATSMYAQSPLAFKYQAVARDAAGQMYANQAVSLQFFFHEDTEAGPVIYAEALQTLTSDFGKFAHDLGTGSAISGLPHNFSSLDWANHQYFLRVKLIVGATEEVIGVSQLLSVPYALYALQAGQSPGDADADPTNEIQQLSLNGNSLELSKNGGAVNLPTPPTYSAGNGIQITGTVITNTGDTNPNDDLTNTSTAAGDVSGLFSNLQINANAVGTPEIANGAVTGGKIAQQGATTGQVLKWNGTSWAPLNDNGDSYTAGPGINITGSAISNTGDTNPNDDLTTSSTAAGDVTGLFSNLQINANAVGTSEIANGAVTGGKIAQQGATNGQVLKWSGTSWVPQNDSSTIYTAGAGINITGTAISNTGDTNPNDDLTTSSNAAGDVTGLFSNLQINANTVGTPEIANGAVTGGKIAQQGATTGQVLQWNGTSWVPANDGFTGVMNGDVNGPLGSNEVTGLRGRPIGGMPPGGGNTGYAYVYDGDSWELSTPAGDLEGTFSDVEVTALRGRPIGGMPPSGASSALIYIPNGANDGAFDYSDPSSDITVDGAQRLSVAKIQNLPVDFTNGIGDGMVLTCIDGGNGLQFECRTPSGGNFSIPYSNSVNLNSTMFSLTNTFTTNNEAVAGMSVQHRGPFAIKGSTNQDYQLFGFGNQGAGSTQLSNKNFYYPAGIYGENTSTHPDSAGAGVLGRAVAGNNNNRGVGGWFQGNSVGTVGISYPNGAAGVVGYATGSRYGGFFKLVNPAGGGILSALYAETNNDANSYAGYFYGDVYVTDDAEIGDDLSVYGSVNANVKNFKIDHPLDPANKFLYHSSIESPDMKNIYDGVIKTDAEGLATVFLPGYFEALNKDFRYQLTVIGTFAQAIVFQKVENNQFVIKTNQPNVEVSWQITGIRKDPYAEAHRTVPEVEKNPEQRGYYVNPELYGQPKEMRVNALKPKQ